MAKLITHLHLALSLTLLTIPHTPLLRVQGQSDLPCAFAWIVISERSVKRLDNLGEYLNLSGNSHILKKRIIAINVSFLLKDWY